MVQGGLEDVGGLDGGVSGSALLVRNCRGLILYRYKAEE